jgi:hypothetical protein
VRFSGKYAERVAAKHPATFDRRFIHTRPEQKGGWAGRDRRTQALLARRGFSYIFSVQIKGSRSKIQLVL